MALSTQLAETAGVVQASVVMGTPANVEILAATGLMSAGLDGAGPNDLLIAVETAYADTLDAALAMAEALLQDASSGASRMISADLAPPRTVTSAVRARTDANIALVSVPGEYAAAEASAALRRGLHVFLFSDNVPIEEEVGLKTFAEERGLLVMGPDCGTALVGGAPLGFANAVRRGSIGIVASSGTGLQEVSSQIHRLGEGVSHALGTGSRDLSAVVGGRSFLAALDALAADADTRVLVLVAKPGSPEVQARVYRRLAEVGKPTVLFFLGQPAAVPPELGVTVAVNLEHAARCAVALAHGEPPPSNDLIELAAVELARRLLEGMSPAQRRVVGLFAGGTLAQEAAAAIARALRADGEPGSMLDLDGHSILDLGDDAYTRGRPHPLIDARLRNERLVAEAGRGGVALFLLDVILGYGAHPDPAAALGPALDRARAVAKEMGEVPRVLGALTGTDEDPQGYESQRRAFEALGVSVAPSSSVAALAAGLVASTLSAVN
jgi:succinyl-CoA synthetase alpha subunit